MVVQYVIGSILIVMAVLLSTLILMQTGKDANLSSTLAGSADTFFGRSGGDKKDRILARLTVVGSVVFVILTIVLVVLI